MATTWNTSPPEGNRCSGDQAMDFSSSLCCFPFGDKPVEIRDFTHWNWFSVREEDAHYILCVQAATWSCTCLCLWCADYPQTTLFLHIDTLSQYFNLFELSSFQMFLTCAEFQCWCKNFISQSHLLYKHVLYKALLPKSATQELCLESEKMKKFSFRLQTICWKIKICY